MNEINYSPEVARKLLQIRDLLIVAVPGKADDDELYHILYSIASPNFDKTNPWEEMENKAKE